MSWIFYLGFDQSVTFFFPGCIFFFPQGNLLGMVSSSPQSKSTSIYIKNHRFLLKTKKVIATFWKFWDFFRSKKSKILDLENFHFHSIFNENFWNFWDRKFRKFSISDFSKIFIGKCMKMKIFEIENFRKISISIFFIFIQFPMKIFYKFPI